MLQPSLNLYALAWGFALRMRVSVKGMTVSLRELGDGRATKINELDYTGSGTVATTPMGSQSYQVYVVSDVRG
jgi:hypothetical protein